MIGRAEGVAPGVRGEAPGVGLERLRVTKSKTRRWTGKWYSFLGSRLDPLEYQRPLIRFPERR